MHPLHLANVALWWVRFNQMEQNQDLVEVVAPEKSCVSPSHSRAWIVVMFYNNEI